jgi:L-2-hydroxyglutarate oxidase LhgO
MHAERIGVIGGGIVGVAIARALALRGLGEVTVLEKERRLAAHQSGHNSGVVHAGLYYAPGSLKARLCALAYRELGKLVVAVDESELPALAEIERRAGANRVPDLRRLDGRTTLREVEPHTAGIAALHSPHTASVDYVAITEAMATDVRQSGGVIILDSRVVGIRPDGSSGVAVSVDGGPVHLFDRVIACAGLQSDVVGRMAGADASPRILPFRGEYWTLDPRRADLVRGMIYPVPDPRFPFLGVHFTRGVDDRVHVGPNAVPALAREGYRWSRFSRTDTWESLRWAGAGPLVRRHWRVGADEIAGSLLKSRYVAKARRFIPELRAADLVAKEGHGVRAQAWSRDGSLLDDFAIDQIGRVTVLRNAPSPAATSAIAIADHVIDEVLGLTR